MRTRSSTPLLVLLLVLGLIPAFGPAATAQDAEPDDGTDDILVVTRDGSGAPRGLVDVAVELSQAIWPGAGEEGSPTRVVLASSRSFADALAASVLLDDAPLLVTPADGLPFAVRDELDRLRPLEVVVLGGTAAISEAVEADVEALGLETRRIAGASRIETAVAVARDAAPTAETAIVVRATDAAGGDTSAAWADSVAAGALAAERGWPILLTTSEGLSAATRAHLQSSTISEVLIVGGTAAVSSAVEEQLLGTGAFVERIAGANRAETAVLLAQARGVPAFGRAVVVEGDGDLGWLTGIAAAGHAADTAAAVLPIPGSTIPAEIQAYLDQTQPLAFTCLVSAAVCQLVGGRVSGGGASVEGVVYSPPPGVALRPGETVVVGLDDPDRRYTGAISVTGADGCTVGSPTYLPEAQASFTVGDPADDELREEPFRPGPVQIQPEPDEGEFPTPPEDTGATTGGSGEVSPVDPDEDGPGEAPPTRCLIAVAFDRVDGGTDTDQIAYDVVDLDPHIRVTSFPQVEGRPVTFEDRTTGVVDVWAWSFGDGDGSAEQHPVHTYASRGCVDVDLEVTSPYSHWHSGRLFENAFRRRLDIDPADGDTHLEVLVIDRGNDDARVVGGPVIAQQGATTVERTTGPDGRADFGDLGEGSWLIFSPEQPATGFVQEVVGGHTLCPTLALGPVGDVEVTVIDADGVAITGATVTIRDGDGTVAARGTTNASGVYLAEDVLEGGYEVTATRSSGAEIGTATASVVEDEVAEVEIREPAPEEPPAPPAP